MLRDDENEAAIPMFLLSSSGEDGFTTDEELSDEVNLNSWWETACTVRYTYAVRYGFKNGPLTNFVAKKTLRSTLVRKNGPEIVVILVIAPAKVAHE
eukprot:scaffold8353_cov138-Cylindrotheca_fusiformis.AAC.2